ncbi:TPA: DMT family transporter [Campylobacter fetus subsp. venerealis]|nr:DMT family transporter [Campylobacter fetus subsp. venerealis]
MKKSVIAEILLIFVAISWGMTFVPVAEAIKSVNVFSFLFWRFLIATIFMFVFCIKICKFDKKSIYYGLFLGFWLFCGFAFQTYALKYSYSSTVAFITGLSVVLVPFLMLVFFKQSVNKFAFGGALIAFIGLYFLSGTGEFGLGKGEILSIICAVCYALHISFTGVLVSKCNIYAMVICEFFAVTILSFFGAILFESGDTNSLFQGLQISFETEFLMALIVCALFATVFAFFVQSYAQIYTTATKTALIFTLEPVSAGLAGYYIANEILSVTQVLGATAILFGMLFSEIGSNLIKQATLKFEN